MADIATVNIKGLAEIERRLKALPEKLRRRAIRKALKDGSELIREDAERRAPRRMLQHGWEAFVGDDDTESLKNNITSRVSVTQKRASARVGIDYSKIRYGHLVEFGHRIVINGKDTGRMSKKRPFMRPAYDSQGDNAVNVIVEQLAKAVEDEI